MQNLSDSGFRYAAFAIIVAATSGCAILSETVTEAATDVGKGVTFYCNNTDAYVRDQFAFLVNQGAAPNSINVTCVNGYRLDSLSTPPAPPAATPAVTAPVE